LLINKQLYVSPGIQAVSLAELCSFGDGCGLL
jgi:hypothetical protein